MDTERHSKYEYSWKINKKPITYSWFENWKLLPTPTVSRSPADSIIPNVSRRRSKPSNPLTVIPSRTRALIGTPAVAK